MIRSAIARYDIREVLGTLNHELHHGDNTPQTLEKNIAWIIINLNEMYGLNTLPQLPIPGSPKWRAEQLQNAPRAREVLFRAVKPPTFDYSTTPNFQCEIMIRKDETLVLTFE